MKSKTKETQVVSIESQSSVSWNFRAVIGLALGVGLASQGVNASTFTWNGGSGSGSKFSSRSNWNGTAPPTYSSANIFQFAGTTRLSPVNDLGTLLLLGIEFNSGAGAFTLTDANTSNSITLGGSGITNNSANTQTVNNKLKLSAAQTFNNTLTGGTLAVGGTVNLQTYTLTLDGSNAIDLSGVISGSGALVKNGTGTTTLSGANTYTGATTINAGTLALGASNGLANTGTINITGGTLNVNGKTETIANLNLTSGAFINGGGTLTVGTDYNNTGFGTGNTFNKSAGVTTTAINSSATNAATQQTLTVGTGTANNGSTASTMVFGNLHVGQTSAAQTYTIGNAGNAGSSTLRGAVKNDGTLDTRLSGTGIATGGSDWSAVAGANNGAKTVTFTASTAGALSETLTVLNNFSNTISQQTLNISGAAYDFAKMTAISPITLANQRLGGTAIQALSVTNGAATGLYSEKLDATITASSSPIIASGSAISGLAAGATNNSNFTVGVDTATAGAKSGTAAIRLVSNGTGTSGLANTTLAAQNVTVSGNVYRTASGSTAATVNLGAQHVGGLASQALTVSNNSINDSYSEKLDAIFGTATGAISTSGIASLIGAGSNSTAMSVGVNTTSAGAKTGNVGVNFSSDGTGTSGLATIGAGTQNVAVSGNVYNYAQMNVISPITLANQRIGGTAIQALSVTNGAATGLYSEKLDATITASSSPIIASGSAISGLAAGATNNSNFTVGVDTATAGAKSGIAAIRLVSNGTGTSGLANTTLAAQNVTVSGNVYRTASGSTAATVNLGAQHVGGLASQALTVSNNSINDSYSEKLDAIFGTATGAISTSGIASLIGAGSNSTAMSVGVNTTSAGAKTGNVSVNFSSDGTGTSGLATIGAGTQNVAVSGNVYNYAQMNVISPITLANQRIGGTAIQALSVTNGAATGLYSEKLDATITASSSPIIASGSAISGLAAGATNNSNFTVGVDTATAGAKSGIAAIRLVSNGTGTSGLANTTLAAQNVTVSGNVYRTASGSTAATVNLGAQHVGGLASQALTVSNNSINDSYSEKLDAIFGTATGAISTSGIASLIGAGSNSTAMSVGVNTTSAGAKTGNVSVNFSSDGTGTSGLATIGAGTQNVAVSGNVYNYANAGLQHLSGGNWNGTGLTLDFGTFTQGSGTQTSIFNLANSGLDSTYTDLLDGKYTFSLGSAFSSSNVSNFRNLAGGSSITNLGFLFDTRVVGNYIGHILLAVNGHNASGFNADLSSLDITFKGSVSAVPLPTSVWLFLAGMMGLLGLGHRKKII